MCQEYHNTPSQTKVRFVVYGNQSSPINGISTFLASTYDHHSTNPTVSFFHNLGLAVPYLIRNLTIASYSSYELDQLGNPGVDFSGCKVLFHNMGSERDATKARSRYSSRPVTKSKRQLKMEGKDFTKMKTIKQICSILPQCEFCHRHFNTVLL